MAVFFLSFFFSFLPFCLNGSSGGVFARLLIEATTSLWKLFPFSSVRVSLEHEHNLSMSGSTQVIK